jgi:hypothetical protein
MRDVRSESETASQSESTSHSIAKSQSETHGTSQTDTTNSGTSTGRSWGINTAETLSRNLNYAQGFIFRHYDFSKVGQGWSQSQGKSKGWTEGTSKGVSHSVGTSETHGTSVTETDGTTKGTSQSTTSGTSETIQKRALITSDEIGQVFARIDDKTQFGYPGLALVVISGARPLALRRVNYYEDYQFMGLFDPAPDFPFTAPKELSVQGSQFGLSLPEFGLKVGTWSLIAGNIAASNDGAASIVSGDGKDAASIRVPRAGLVAAVQAGGATDLPAGPLFSLRYYEDGAALVDPFAELRALCASIAKQREDEKRRAEEQRRRRKRILIAAAACCVVLILIVAIAGIVSVRNRPDSGAEVVAPSASDARPDPVNPANAPVSGIPPEPAPTAPANPASPGAIVIGKIDVSRFAGLKSGDTPAQAAAVFGPTGGSLSGDNGTQGFDTPRRLLVSYHNGGAESVMLYSDELEFARSHAGNDPLFDLFGRSKADAVETLGQPTGRDSSNGNDFLYWYFPSHGRNDEQADLITGQHKVLVLDFKTGVCDYIRLNW